MLPGADVAHSEHKRFQQKLSFPNEHDEHVRLSSVSENTSPQNREHVRLGVHDATLNKPGALSMITPYSHNADAQTSIMGPSRPLDCNMMGVSLRNGPSRREFELPYWPGYASGTSRCLMPCLSPAHTSFFRKSFRGALSVEYRAQVMQEDCQPRI